MGVAIFITDLGLASQSDRQDAAAQDSLLNNLRLLDRLLDGMLAKMRLTIKTKSVSAVFL